MLAKSCMRAPEVGLPLLGGPRRPQRKPRASTSSRRFERKRSGRSGVPGVRQLAPDAALVGQAAIRSRRSRWPAPERLPVECWQPIQSGSERAFDFMAKHGICGIIGGGSAEGGAVERHMIGFQAAYARRGIELELGERLALGFQFHIAKSREDGMSEAAKHYEENMKMFGELRL